jgi:hypothetical protein
MTSHCLAAFFLAAVAACAQGRVRPPAKVGCDRNNLTVYHGKVRQYTRDKTQVKLTIDTEEKTVERIVLKLDGSRTAESRFLWAGEPFQPRHWKELESAPGKLQPGIMVNAWVCTNGGPPLLDWQSPAR